jgi:two-component system chemotaxis response regulator CheB
MTLPVPGSGPTVPGRSPIGPPGRIRILVVDDSAVIRRVVTDVLNGDPELEVVGTAANGRIALEKLDTLQPDLVTLDVEMPEMDGLATLTQLRMRYRRLPVIMFSSVTERAGTITIEALARGASDYVTKPSGSTDVEASKAHIRAELVPKVKALCARRLAGPRLAQTAALRAAAPARAVPVAPLPGPTSPLARHEPGTIERAVGGYVRPAPTGAGRRRVDVVAIGVSTGGPNALAVLLPSLVNVPVPIVVVQHMPPLFTKLLADQLTNSTKLSVREGETGDHHMVVERDGPRPRLRLNQGPPENSCRPSVDVLFRSVAATYGAGVLAVVLTGMGSDGALGAKAINTAGGHVLVQDEASSVVWGMPGAVVRAGVADQVLSLGDLGPAVAHAAARPGVR